MSSETISGQTLFIMLLRVQNRLLDELQVVLKQHEISEPQFNVLRILRGAGGEGLACQEISRRMVTRVPDITRILDRLERRRFVRRVRGSGPDRRVVLAHLESGGRQLLESLDGPVRELHERQFSPLNPEERRQLAALLSTAEHRK